MSSHPKESRASRTGDATADHFANSGVLNGDVTINYAPEGGVKFAHIGIPLHARQEWEAFPHIPAFLGCEFADPCERLFALKNLVYDADLFFDLILANMGDSPAVVSRVGIRVETVQQIIYMYGYPEASVIRPAAHEYEIVMPDISSDHRVDFMDHMAPAKVEVDATHDLADPMYLPPHGIYRYVLHLKSFQKNMPNHSQVRLTAEVNGGEVRSPILHVFTK